MNPNSSLHLDARETAFFEKELTRVMTKSFDEERKDLKALQLIPVSPDQDFIAKTIEWKSYTQVGIAKFVSDYANDFPRIDVGGVEHTAKVKTMGDSYGYSIEDIRRAAALNMPLSQRKAAAAVRAIDELQDRVAWFGEADLGIQGLINFPGITEYAVQNGAGGSKAWADKTADEIYADVIGLITTPGQVTNGKENPDTLIMDLAHYNKLASTPFGDNKDKTLLSFIRTNFPSLTRIEWVQELATAGAGGTSRMMAYTRDPDKLELLIPWKLEQFDPERRGQEYIIDCLQKTAGVVVYRPLSVAFGDGI